MSELGFPTKSERWLGEYKVQAELWLPALFPQWDDAGTVSPGADSADNPAQLAEEQAGGGRARLQVSGAPLGASLWGLLVLTVGSPVPSVYSFFLLSIAS